LRGKTTRAYVKLQRDHLADRVKDADDKLARSVEPPNLERLDRIALD
jgi:hypothetical protein